MFAPYDAGSPNRSTAPSCQHLGITYALIHCPKVSHFLSRYALNIIQYAFHSQTPARRLQVQPSIFFVLPSILRKPQFQQSPQLIIREPSSTSTAILWCRRT